MGMLVHLKVSIVVLEHNQYGYVADTVMYLSRNVICFIILFMQEVNSIITNLNDIIPRLWSLSMFTINLFVIFRKMKGFSLL